jgi:alpha-glucosidase (family GH31 glycosyl hydrolase)
MRISKEGIKDVSTNRSAIVGGDGKYRFTVVADGLLRYEWAPDGHFEDRPSSFAFHRDQPVPDFQVRETEGTLEIFTSRFHLTYNKEEFTPYGLFAIVYGDTRAPWRYGEDDSRHNLGGTARTLDEIDGRIDMGFGILSEKGSSSLDDSESFLFEKDGFVAPRRAGSGRIDGYLFAYGHDYRTAVKAFYAISGPPPLLPRWTLGNWWSRYYEYSADSYLTLMNKFKETEVPLCVGVIDMDWHLVDDPRVIEAGQTGWTGYTWNKDLFPDPPKFINELHKLKLKTTLNEHPADGIHSYEDMYEKVAKAVGQSTAHKEPVPFNIADRQFLKAYFDVLLKSLEDDGVDFWWIDWQQGPYSRLKGIDPLWMLNHYHFLHNAERNPDKHPLIFSRYAGPGSHRYPIGFSGDTVVSWASLDFQPEFTATASNIGYGWWSHDIGGHMFGVRDEELLVRWTQLGVLSPIMRLHSTKSRWMAKEPWTLPPHLGDVMNNWLRLRHRLIPYLHTMNARAALDGEPLIQPMYWEYPKRKEAYQHKNQYLFGTELIVIPITSPLDPKVRLAKTKGWLPPGRYVDFFTGVAYDGDRELWISRPLEQYPLFLKEGSIVPLDHTLKPTNGGENPSGFEVIIAVGADGHFEILEEEGESQGRAAKDIDWNKTAISFTQETGTVEIHPPSKASGASAHPRKWSLRFVGLSHVGKIAVKGIGRVEDSKAKVSQVSNGILIDIGEVPAGEKVTVELGLKNPQLDLGKEDVVSSLIEPIIKNAQIEYPLKDAIWEVVDAKKGTAKSAILNRLQTLDMSLDLGIAIAEFLVDDP